MASIKMGVFGAWRGNSYIDLMLREPEIDLVAICDKNIDNLCDDGKLAEIPKFRDFDEFLSYGKENGMNAVFLANYFHQHAPFAIKAMNAGLDVFSECTAASTLKECVELVETVEKTGRKYMLCENYPFSNEMLKMEEIAREGALGSLLYAEGEYNHSGGNEELRRLTPGRYHWRAWMPRTYYLTHSLGPIMYITKTEVRYVSARASHSDLLYELREWRHNYDGAAHMLCEMSGGMTARFTGCTAMASDYGRSRVCGDISGVEAGGYIPGGKVRQFWHEHTKPVGQNENTALINPELKDDKEAKNAGHGGGDYRVVQNIKDYLICGKEPFFDVYRAVNMSATAILGWRSCLNHGENFKVPDFRNKEEREAVRDDDLTPFPDENGEGATLPAALPFEE